MFNISQSVFFQLIYTSIYLLIPYLFTRFKSKLWLSKSKFGHDTLIFDVTWVSWYLISFSNAKKEYIVSYFLVIISRMSKNCCPISKSNYCHFYPRKLVTFYDRLITQTLNYNYPPSLLSRRLNVKNLTYIYTQG